MTAAGALPAAAAGLTGADHAGDVVFARQLLMDGINLEMQAIDQAAGGADLALESLRANADLISTMLTAFPHLFPPETSPDALGADASTTALATVWEDFEGFYGATQAAATLAYDASQATAMEQFRDKARELRAACDSCHAQFMQEYKPPF